MKKAAILIDGEWFRRSLEVALKHIVDRIILVSGDTDMIPAMKLARREGVQVVMVEVFSPQGMSLSKALDEDTDLVRTITPKP